MFYFTSDEKREERGFEIRVKQLANSCYNPSAYGFRMSPPAVSTTSTPYLISGYPSVVNNTIYNCDRLITAQLEVITSPNYPNNYPPTTRCIYTFLKSMPNVCQVRLKILDLDLEHTKDCTTDYLLLEPTGQKFCGQFIEPEDKSKLKQLKCHITNEDISRHLSQLLQPIPTYFQFRSPDHSSRLQNTSGTANQFLY